MLGFAIVDRQSAADATAVCLTCRIEDARANHTNAVVITHDDEWYDAKVWALTIERVVRPDGRHLAAVGLRARPRR